MLISNSAHPSIFYTRLICRGAKAYPSGHRARGRVHPGQVASSSQGHTEIHNHTRSLLGTILESPINLTCMFLDSGRKPEYPERTHTYGENMQTPHRKAPARSWTGNPLAVRQRCYPAHHRAAPSSDHVKWQRKKNFLFFCVCVKAWLAMFFPRTSSHLWPVLRHWVNFPTACTSCICLHMSVLLAF